MTFVRVGGIPHHIRVDGPRTGSGPGPACLLSVGLGMSWFDWDPVVPLLAPYRTVVRFDRPGLGLSGPAPAHAWPTLTGEAQRIACVLDATGIGTPVTVVGHSLAGLHCEAFARLYPERTAGLVLVDSGTEEDPRPRRAPALRNTATRACGTFLAGAGLPRALGPLLRRTAVRAGRHIGHRPGLRSGGDPAAYDPAAYDPAPYDLVRSAYSTSRFLRAVLAENASYRDQAAELASLRERLGLAAPVTVLAAYAGGSRRWLDRQERLADRLGGTFRTVAPAGHLVMLDRPGDVADAVLDTPRHPPPATG
ncbi:pimeloyl-ACP methyl ester carboxylesterase [Streptomyces sp. V3I8]|uniref:alpha/beta fold hydrolase n=1 Tax=Streptomyces sp. V3I8 TaxID=3042279 RepID=UPI002785A90A|nr:alpha/beta hydrolase [Streptomyces sp. V3I8]MDQ1039081.1 pimeloyl-ACP methyl ester carboxylesterase [Streptomyces sp. V3I8]